MSFIRSENGAVTVDWVVLTAALVGLGLAVMSVVSTGVEDLSGDIETQLAEQPIATSFREFSNWEFVAFNQSIYESYVTEWQSYVADPGAYDTSLSNDLAYLDTEIAALNGPRHDIAVASFEEIYDSMAAGIDVAAENDIEISVTYDDLYEVKQRYDSQLGG